MLRYDFILNRVNPAGTLSCNKVATKSRHKQNVSDSQSFPRFNPVGRCHFFPRLDSQPEARQMQRRGRQLPGVCLQPPGLCRGLRQGREVLLLQPPPVGGQSP